jgi:uroporphyrin-III C-methyltransferase / precorrin-2 dehydrogenase / sirohydrochlorin ferrochelatase
LWPKPPSGLDGLVSHGGLAWVARRFEPAQLDGVVAVFAAADDVTNKAVFEAARARNVPVNVVDRPELSTFLTPAIVDRDPLIVAIGTEGTGPVLAQGRAGAHRGHAALSHRRACHRGGPPAPAGGTRRLPPARAAARSGQTTSSARRRRPSLPAASRAMARPSTPRSSEANAARPGRVSFLTAPADPELLTLKAHRKLQDADVIVHDSGADPRILDYARRDAARVAVEAACPDLLLREAAKGAQVVRLRSEAARLVASSARELAALAAAGIAVEIVAGPGLATPAASETEWRAA